MAGSFGGLSHGSAQVNGQLVGFQTAGAYRPLNYGSGLSAVPAASPLTIPPSASSLPQVAGGIQSGQASGGTAPASTSALNLAQSPAIWAVIFLVLGFVILRHVHWRKG